MTSAAAQSAPGHGGRGREPPPAPRTTPKCRAQAVAPPKRLKPRPTHDRHQVQTGEYRHYTNRNYISLYLYMQGTIICTKCINDLLLLLVLCLGWNVRLIVSLPRRYDVMTLRKPIVTWYVKTFRNVNYVC